MDGCVQSSIRATENPVQQGVLMRNAFVLALLLLSANVGLVAGADKKSTKPAGELPAIQELPNPFVFSDGAVVRDANDWKRRREELKKLFQDYEYGWLPAKPEKMAINRGETVIDEENMVAIQDLEVNWQHKGNTLLMHVRLAWPRDAKKAVPVVMRSSFGRRGQGAPPSGKPFAAFTKRGYGVAELSLQEVALDNKERARTAGIYRLFDDKIDCGGLMAWAWGFHRVVDVIETTDKLDAKKIIVTGHSRYGKAALLAGAFDERIALTVPSHSGCGGAAPYRFIYGKNEQLHNIVGAFPYWFRPDFKQFVGNVERLPIDQHMLLALVAPRLCSRPKALSIRGSIPKALNKPMSPPRRSTTFSRSATKSVSATDPSDTFQATTI